MDRVPRLKFDLIYYAFGAIMSLEKISIGDTVKHKNKEIEMLVIAMEKHWVTCEFTAEDGERIEKIYDKDYLVIIEKKPPQSIPKLNLSTNL